MSAKPPGQRGDEAPINPAMRQRVDDSYGSRFEGTDPMTTVSVKDPDEGRGWPVVWAIVVIVCIGLVIYYLVA